MKYEYLILGGGIAGYTAAETLRKLRPEAEIGLVSEESHPLYSRVLLPHYIKGKVPRERVFLRSADHLAKHNVKTWMGNFAVGIDTKGKKVILDNGEEIIYGKLLIATGGRATIPEGAKLKNSHLFRGIEDADEIISALQALPSGTVCAAMGSSFIALEFPPLFEKFGMKTEMHMRGPGFFHRTLDRDSADLIEDVIREHGGTIQKNQSAGSYPQEAKFVGIGLGMEMNIKFAKDVGIEIGAGIITNEYLETNIPNIWAAGDVAEFWDVTVGKKRLLGNWMNAEMQGRVAATNMAGEKNRYAMVSSYSTRVFDLVICFIGDVESDAKTKIVVRASRGARSITKIFLRENIAVGATIVGSNTDRGPITELIKNAVKIKNPEQIGDGSFDLKKLL